MTLKNSEIYNMAKLLNEAFMGETQYLPAKLYFFIQKNKNKLTSLAVSIEEARQNIIKHYGTLSSDGQTFNFSIENRNKANEELSDLLNLEEDVDIVKIKLSELNNINFTPMQMEALFFMIEED